MSFKYVFKNLVGASLRHKVFLVSKMIVLPCPILGKLERPETSISLFIVNTHTCMYIYVCMYIHLPVNAIARLPHPRSEDSQGQETFFSSLC